MTLARRHRRRARAVALAAALALLAAPGRAAAADVIDTVAGSGTGGFGGDGGPAVAALLTSPSDVAPTGDGGFLVADASNHRIRLVTAGGTIITVAGAGPAVGAPGAFAGDGLAATDPATRLNGPRGVAALPDGGFLIADTGNDRIRRVSPAGVITTVAGGGSIAADGVPATAIALRAPTAVAALPDGGFLIADTGNHVIRRVDARGIATRVAGNLTATSGGFGGDGGPATSATLNGPTDVVPLAGGGFLIADTGNHRIRRVALDGTIATVAGGGSTAGFGGDGGRATAAQLNGPEGVAVRADGALVIADTGNERIREVDAGGAIRTLAGTGTLGLAGDGGPPLAAQLSHPRGVALAGARLLIADAFNHRVRAIAPAPATDPPPPAAPPVPPPPRTVPPGVAPPLLGRTAVATPVRGRVLIRRPGARAFAPLAGAASVPLGSEVDVRDGAIALQFTTDRRGRRASAVASGGRFVVRQPRRPGRIDRGQRPGTLVLSGPFAGCARPGARTAAAAAGPGGPVAAAAARRRRRGRRGRRLQVRADGSIKTKGRWGAAIVRGTRWTVVDRCPADRRAGTLVAVAEGRVAVRAFALRRTVLVRAGRRFLAPARR